MIVLQPTRLLLFIVMVVRIQRVMVVSVLICHFVQYRMRDIALLTMHNVLHINALMDVLV
jgi:hypothetical protein